MINKPVNAYPYNVCVRAGEPFDIRCELPSNTTIDGAFVSIKTLEGVERWSSYLKLNNDNVITTSVINDLNTDKNSELCWSSFYWDNLDKENYSALISKIDKVSGEIRLVPKASNEKVFYSDYKVSECRYNKHIIKYGDLTGYKNVCNVFSSETPVIYWGDVNPDYSSLTPEEEAKTMGYSDCKEYTCCLINPTDNLLECLKECKNTLGSESIAIAAKDTEGDLVFYSEIENFVYFNGDHNINYLAIFGSNGAEWGLTREGMIDGGTQGISHNGCWHDQVPCGKFFLTNTIEIVSGFSSPCDKDDILLVNMEQKHIVGVEKKGAEYLITTEPTLNKEINNLYPYQSLGFFKTNPENWNVSQSFYFRYKSPPALSIVNTSEIVTLSDESPEGIIVTSTKQINNVKCEFGISYESQYKLNYFYLYLMEYDEVSREWCLLSSSEMLNSPTATHTFDGLMDDHNYAVYCVCYDIDGDEWESEKYNFTVSNPPTVSDKISAEFNRESMTVDVSLTNILPLYKNINISLYKTEIGASIKPSLLKYSGGGYCKTGGESYGEYEPIDGFVTFNTIRDYNIRNNVDYKYYVMLSYDGVNYDTDEPLSGVVWFEIPNVINTDFAGSSIIGLKQISDNNYEITDDFKIIYTREAHEEAMEYSISRNYADTVGEYSYEIKGSQNYKSGECRGLLGECIHGEYVEPALLPDKWQKFVDSDDIKIYRGINGETMAISIEATRIAKPSYANTKRVSDVTFSFREIADINNYVVCETKLVEV